MTRHWNKLAKHINYVAEHRGEASTHKIDNKQHEDCARQYLNAMNKAAQEEKGQMVTAPKRDRAPNNNDAKKKRKQSRKTPHRNETRSPKFRMEHIVLANTESRRGKKNNKSSNKPAHSSHSLCAQQSKGVKTGPNKITNNLTIALSNFCSFVCSSPFLLTVRSVSWSAHWIRVNYSMANELPQQSYRISNGVQLKRKRKKATIEAGQCWKAFKFWFVRKHFIFIF